MIVSLLNGGPAFAGKTGRNTANACEATQWKHMQSLLHISCRAVYKNREA
jgi:hypothetical protein